jgi:hypothetical protein
MSQKPQDYQHLDLREPLKTGIRGGSGLKRKS